MKVKVNRVEDKLNESAVINVVDITDSVNTAISLLENGDSVIIGYKNGDKVPCRMSMIYYIESIDEKCFLYTKDDCFEVKFKLYELEQILDFRFLRISKSMICNFRKIRSVKSEVNARLKATLLNGEIVIISRSYVKDLKKRLGI